MAEMLSTWTASRSDPVCRVTVKPLVRMYYEVALSVLGLVIFSRSGAMLVAYGGSLASDLAQCAFWGVRGDRASRLSLLLSAWVSCAARLSALFTLLASLCLQLLHPDVSQPQARWSLVRGSWRTPSSIGNELFRAGIATPIVVALCATALAVVLVECVCFFLVVPLVWRSYCCRGLRRKRARRSFASVVPDPTQEEEPSADGMEDSDLYWLGAPTLSETWMQQLRTVAFFTRERRALLGFSVLFCLQLPGLAIGAESTLHKREDSVVC